MLLSASNFRRKGQPVVELHVDRSLESRAQSILIVQGQGCGTRVRKDTAQRQKWFRRNTARQLCRPSLSCPLVYPPIYPSIHPSVHAGTTTRRCEARRCKSRRDEDSSTNAFRISTSEHWLKISRRAGWDRTRRSGTGHLATNKRVSK